MTDLVTPFVILSSPQRFTHCGAGFGFAYGVEVAADVAMLISLWPNLKETRYFYHMAIVVFLQFWWYNQFDKQEIEGIYT